MQPGFQRYTVSPPTGVSEDVGTLETLRIVEGDAKWRECHGKQYLSSRN